MEATQPNDFQQLCTQISTHISIERSETKTYADTEFALLSKLPAPILNLGVLFLLWLDKHNLLPLSFIQNDGLYTSAFVTNLGSLQMKPAYHHLYEWGNCPLFLMVGKIEDKPVVCNNTIQIRQILPIRVAFDERINDGLTANKAIQDLKFILENPDTAFCKLEGTP